jgi:hypothetical protein
MARVRIGLIDQHEVVGMSQSLAKPLMLPAASARGIFPGDGN